MKGERVLVLRPEGRAEPLASMLEAMGAKTLIVPAVEIVPPSNVEALSYALSRTDEFDWIVFTSASGVHASAPIILRPKLQIAAVGPATRNALVEAGMNDVWIPPAYTTQSLAMNLPGHGKVLTVRAQGAGEELEQVLRDRGFEVERVDAYGTKLTNPDRIRDAVEAGVDAIALTSASIAHSLASALGGKPPGAAICCIGPPTARECSKLGLSVDVVADEHTASGLARAIELHFSSLGEAS